MLFDTHCHLDFSDFQKDLDAVIERARSARVTRMISIGTNLESSQRALALAEKFPDVFAAIGHHPCNYDDFRESHMELLAKLSRHPKVVAIGECGLDYHHLPPAESFPSSSAYEKEIHRIKALQKHIFVSQLNLAEREKLNVVIHQRNSWEDCIHTLSPFHGRIRAVFHCFSESTQRALFLIEQNHLVSFTGIATFKKLDTLRQTISELPPGSFMLETDSPYLAPIPNRGKRCEPFMISETAKVVAQVRNTSLELIAGETCQTAKDFFRFP